MSNDAIWNDVNQMISNWGDLNGSVKAYLSSSNPYLQSDRERAEQIQGLVNNSELDFRFASTQAMSFNDPTLSDAEAQGIRNSIAQDYKLHSGIMSRIIAEIGAIPQTQGARNVARGYVPEYIDRSEEHTSELQ